jgi:hypothetical protein
MSEAPPSPASPSPTSSPLAPPASSAPPAPSAPASQQWEYDKIAKEFDTVGCSIPGCPFHRKGDEVFKCALNLSDAVISANYTLPTAPKVNLCPHGRVRNADGMARIVKKVVGGPHAQGWSHRPNWKGIVYFEGGPSLQGATGHIDLWNGSNAVHREFPDANVIWFFRLLP